jgi:hypothetical protein
MRRKAMFVDLESKEFIKQSHKVKIVDIHIEKSTVAANEKKDEVIER